MRSAFVIALIVAQACDPTGPGSSRRRAATLEHYGFAAVLNVPASAQQNVSFNVEFTTYGGGCVERATNEVLVVGLDVQIHSYQRDYTPRAGEACTDDLRFEQNSVPISLSGPGTARIRVFGRRMPGDEGIVLERAVLVSQ